MFGHPYYNDIKSLSALCDKNRKYAALRLPEIIEDECRNGKYMVIGGNVVGAYTEPRVTLDVDIIVDKSTFDNIKRKLEESKVEFVDEGTVLRRIEEVDSFDIIDSSISSIMTVIFQDRVEKNGYSVPSCEGLIALKYYAILSPTRSYYKRSQDKADIINLLRSKPDRKKIIRLLKEAVGEESANLFTSQVFDAFDNEREIIGSMNKNFICAKQKEKLWQKK